MPTVRVWWARLSDARPPLRRLLDATERERLSGYARPADADRFLLGATIIRLAAARDTGLAPDDIEVVRRCESCGAAHGRVRLPGLAAHVSVSHSGDVVGVAFCRDAPVGLDVEAPAHRPVHLALAERTLTRLEATAYARLAEPERRVAFLRYWVRKEAVLKLSGDGIGGGLNAVSVSGAHDPPQVLAWPTRPELAARLSLRDLEPRAGYAAAVAIDIAPPVRVLELDAAILLRDRLRPVPAGPDALT